MNKEERLQLYRTMLKDYVMSFRDSKEDRYTCGGFCNYIAHLECKYGFEINLKEDYPELYKQKPKKCYKKNDTFWYKPGRLLPRIICLIKAINLCKKETK